MGKFIARVLDVSAIVILATITLGLIGLGMISLLHDHPASAFISLLFSAPMLGICLVVVSEVQTRLMGDQSE